MKPEIETRNSVIELTPHFFPARAGVAVRSDPAWWRNRVHATDCKFEGTDFDFILTPDSRRNTSYVYQTRCGYRL